MKQLLLIALTLLTTVDFIQASTTVTVQHFRGKHRLSEMKTVLDQTTSQTSLLFSKKLLSAKLNTATSSTYDNRFLPLVIGRLMEKDALLDDEARATIVGALQTSTTRILTLNYLDSIPASSYSLLNEISAEVEKLITADVDEITIGAAARLTRKWGVDTKKSLNTYLQLLHDQTATAAAAAAAIESICEVEPWSLLNQFDTLSPTAQVNYMGCLLHELTDSFGVMPNDENLRQHMLQMLMQGILSEHYNVRLSSCLIIQAIVFPQLPRYEHERELLSIPDDGYLQLSEQFKIVLRTQLDKETDQNMRNQLQLIVQALETI